MMWFVTKMDVVINIFGSSLKAAVKSIAAVDKKEAQKEFQSMAEGVGVIALVKNEFIIALVSCFVIGLIFGAFIGCCMQCCDCCCSCCKRSIDDDCHRISSSSLMNIQENI